MDNEDKLASQIAAFQDIAKERTDVDEEKKHARKKARAYIISLVLPPFGLLYALYYAFGKKPHGKRIALICVLLTAVSLILSIVIGEMVVTSFITPEQRTQLENIRPEDINEMRQFLLE